MHSDDRRGQEWLEQHAYDRRYMVLRTQHHRPGTPWVIQAMADDSALASDYSRYEEFTREEMLADPELADALRRWESDVDPVHRIERALEVAEQTLLDAEEERQIKALMAEGLSEQDARAQLQGYLSMAAWEEDFKSRFISPGS